MFAPPGACVWGSHCRVPETQGHFCPVCSTSAHSTCTYTNVCAFAESQRARNSGADPASAELLGTALHVRVYWDRYLALQLVRRQHVPPPPAAGGPSSPAPGPSTPRLHRCRCWRAASCEHGHGGQVRACRVVRARARHACDAFASPPSEPC